MFVELLTWCQNDHRLLPDVDNSFHAAINKEIIQHTVTALKDNNYIVITSCSLLYHDTLPMRYYLPGNGVLNNLTSTVIIPFVARGWGRLHPLACIINP